MPRRRRTNKSLTQEINHQLFGTPRRPVRHVGKTLVKGSVNITNSMVNEVLASVFGFGRPSKRRRRRR